METKKQVLIIGHGTHGMADAISSIKEDHPELLDQFEVLSPEEAKERGLAFDANFDEEDRQRGFLKSIKDRLEQDTYVLENHRTVGASSGYSQAIPYPKNRFCTHFKNDKHIYHKVTLSSSERFSDQIYYQCACGRKA